MKTISGFSLIEILIVLAIIGIISAFCIPLYSQHVTQERRLEAAMVLNKLALAVEQRYLTAQSYKGATFKSLHFPDKTPGDHYQLAIQSTTQDYVLQAIPLGEQQRDSTCGTLVLDSSGKKSVTGNGSVEQCW